MPYEYRKYSPKERDEIVKMRKLRGFPLHAPPHPFREAGTYLITAANFEHAPIMANPERRTEFQELLLERFHRTRAEIIGWVVLPNHYHILVNVESLDLVSAVIQHLHGAASHKWNQEDRLTGKRKVWFKYSDRLMRNEVHLQQTLNYIHFNPVKHGLAEDVYDWSWSSIFLYVDDMGKDWLREKWKKFKPPPDFGKDWDI